MKYANDQLGVVQILVNNAGIQHSAGIEDYPEAVFDDVIAINLSATYLASKLAIGGMKQLDWGRIINIASVHGLVASVNKSGYVAAKHGVIGLSKAIGLELAQTNITCNALCPGWVMTDLISKQIQERAERFKISFDEAKGKLLEEKQPSLKAVQPESLGEFALFLCSNAAQEIRGAALTMDGGWTS